MAKEVTMYQAFDGEVFESKVRCEKYEKQKEDEERVAQFLRSKHNVYDKSAHLTVAENTLLAFATWCRGETPVVKEEEETDV
jgi:hypothetical protein